MYCNSIMFMCVYFNFSGSVQQSISFPVLSIGPAAISCYNAGCHSGTIVGVVSRCVACASAFRKLLYVVQAL
jgi:hypothetical protein